MRRTLGAAVLAAALMLLPASPALADGAEGLVISPWDWAVDAWSWVLEGAEKASPFTEPNGGDAGDDDSDSGGEAPVEPDPNASPFTEPNG